MTQLAMMRDDVTEDVAPMDPLQTYLAIGQTVARMRRLRGQIASALHQLDRPGSDWRLPLMCLDRSRRAYEEVRVELNALRGRRVRRRRLRSSAA